MKTRCFFTALLMTTETVDFVDSFLVNKYFIKNVLGCPRRGKRNVSPTAPTFIGNCALMGSNDDVEIESFRSSDTISEFCRQESTTTSSTTISSNTILSSRSDTNEGSIYQIFDDGEDDEKMNSSDANGFLLEEDLHIDEDIVDEDEDEEIDTFGSQAVLLEEDLYINEDLVDEDDDEKMDTIDSDDVLLEDDLYIEEDDLGESAVTFDSDELKSRLTHDQERLGSLARLAVAFCPSNTALELKQIDNIQIVDIDDHHIDISAIVCDDLSCVNVLVPVAFPKECSTVGESHMEECIMENIEMLDHDAQHFVSEKDAETKLQASMKDNYFAMEKFHSSDDVKYPSNWLDATDSDMIEECEKIMTLLNDETFERETRDLGQFTLEMNGYDISKFQVYKSRITAVGPQGMNVRTLALHRASGNQEEDPDTIILDVPYSFDQRAEDAASLRTSVLSAISALSS